MLPSFLVLGAQKAGTSSLYRYVGKHPQVLRAASKELQFFDRRWEEGLDAYRGMFPSALRTWARSMRVGRPVVTGEATPCYLVDPRVPPRVRQTLPDARFVVLLRDPVDRAWSQHHHRVVRGKTDERFEAVVARERAGEADPRPQDAPRFGYLERGRYAEQLERWFAEFPRDRFLVLRSERMFADPAAAVRRVTDFLGLHPYDPARYVREFRVYNRGRYDDPLAPATRRELEAYFAPHQARLEALLGPGWDAA